jgi:hypothetical protein
MKKSLVDALNRPEVTSHMLRVAKEASVIHFTLSGQALDLIYFTLPSTLHYTAPRLTKRDLTELNILSWKPESAHNFGVEARFRT